MTHCYESFEKHRLVPVLLVLAAAAPGAARADCDTSVDPVVISADCSDLQINATRSDVTIAPSITVSPLFAPYEGVHVGNTAQVTGTFLNAGTVTSGFGRNSFVNEGVINKLVNSGVLINNTTSSKQAALLNSKKIETLENTGTISATIGNWGSGAHAILQAGTIGTLNNSGTISAQNSAIYFDAGVTTRIDTLINSGRIEGGLNGGPSLTFASAIELNAGSSIGTIINTGVIDHSVCDSSSCYAAIANIGGNIGTIYNLGHLTSGNTSDIGYGIINGVTGTIGTLENDQTDLKYFGTLPHNYTAVVYGTSSYGKMAVTEGTGVLSFGVEAAAPLGTTTYASVLTGVTQANLAATTGTWGGGMFDNTWTLDPKTPTEWDLLLSSTVVEPSVETGSGEAVADAIIQTVTQSLTTEPTPGTIIPTLQNGVTLQQAAQTFTFDHVDQLSTVSAEGFSSNLTIGLQFMGQIAGAVTGHTHGPKPASGTQGPKPDSSAREPAPIDASPLSKLWIETSVSSGAVKAHDGLSGFGYSLQSVIIGGDILRGTSGGLGVFGGLGHSAMTESDAVEQDFSTTSYLLGVYGGQEFDTGIKLSGALGYTKGRNKSTRFNANIGQFTGGLAQSDYTSEGVFGSVKLAKAMALKNGGSVTPFVGLSYAQLAMAKAVETGGGDFNYTIAKSTSRSAIVSVGADFDVPLSPSSGMNLVGFANIGYDLFADDAAVHTVTTTSHLFGSFDQIGADAGPLSGTFGIGLEGQVAQGVTGRLGGVGSLTRNGYQIGLGGALQW